MLDIYDFYNKMEQNNILLSFKGDVTAELLTSVLQIMESKMDTMDESPKVKKKVYNVLVECLQNLYHHMDEMALEEDDDLIKSAIFMVGKVDNQYQIFTGNYIVNHNIDTLKGNIDKVNAMSKEELKIYYKETLDNGRMSAKGGGGLGIIDIARKSGQNIDYNFMPVNDKHSFFTLNIKILK